MNVHTKPILSQINKIVTPHFCKKTARECKFVQRSTSRLNGTEFVRSMILASESDTLFTLNRRCQKFNPNSEMSNPGLSQRINTESASLLMQSCLAQCLNQTYTFEGDSDSLKKFNRILIQDSTCLELDNSLAKFYPGSSGAASKAAIKIDCIYDFTHEKILNVEHCARNVVDYKNGKIIFDYVQNNDLVLRDLGYLDLDEIAKIDEKACYYISRYKSNMNIYLKKEDDEKLNFVEFLKRKIKKKGFFDGEIYLGRKKIKTRIVVLKLPDEIVNQKLRKARREAQRARKTLSQLSIALLSYTILITNVGVDLINYEEILSLYKVRWRIELLFKEWKSQLKIKNISGRNIHRINCLIYSRLCLVVIMNYFVSYFHKRALEIHGRELSTKRLLDIFLDESVKRSFLVESNFFQKYEESILNKVLKDKRKRKTTRGALSELKIAC